MWTQLGTDTSNYTRPQYSVSCTDTMRRPVTEPVGVVSVVHVRRTMKSDDAHPENALRRVFTPTANTFSTTSANVPSTVKY